MKQMKKFIGAYANLLLLAALVVVAAVAAPTFLSRQNLVNIFRQSCVLGLCSIGLSLVILAGHMDLSIGGMISLTGVLAITFCGIMPAGLAIAAALLLGALLGLLNGALVVFSRANNGESLMITFGTQLLFSAASLVITGGFTLSGSASDFYNAIGGLTLYKVIPVGFLVLLGFTALLSVLEAKTGFGRKLHMVGYNHECSRLSGVKAGQIKLLCYILCGLMAGAAGVMLTSRTFGASPTGGAGFEMEAIIAVVLGGVSLTGGAGSVLRAFTGVLTLGVISNAMNLLGFGVYDQGIVKGSVLILAIAFDAWNRSQLKRG